jgi:hypothetical protein
MLKSGDLVESAGTRLPAGTGARMAELLRPGETRADFVRWCIEVGTERRAAELAEEQRQARIANIETWIAPARPRPRDDFGRA